MTSLQQIKRKSRQKDKKVSEEMVETRSQKTKQTSNTGGKMRKSPVHEMGPEKRRTEDEKTSPTGNKYMSF